jgi:hypothetical protein
MWDLYLYTPVRNFPHISVFEKLPSKRYVAIVLLFEAPLILNCCVANPEPFRTSIIIGGRIRISTMVKAGSISHIALVSNIMPAQLLAA